MPYSSHNGKNTIKEWITNNKERLGTVVDFGAGSGTYGKLLRAIAPGSVLFAVEAYQPYIERFKLKALYDYVFESDIENAKWPDADLAIFGDVLEHFERTQALAILTAALCRYEHVIVSIPIGECPQGASHGNELERHRSTWNFEELKALATWERAELNTEDGKYSIGIFIK